MKKLEEFKQILGTEFDFQTENVDRKCFFKILVPELQGDP